VQRRLKLTIERGWLELDISGTFAWFTQTGADYLRERGGK